MGAAKVTPQKCHIFVFAGTDFKISAESVSCCAVMARNICLHNVDNFSVENHTLMPIVFKLMLCRAVSITKLTFSIPVVHTCGTHPYIVKDHMKRIGDRIQYNKNSFNAKC